MQAVQQNNPVYRYWVLVGMVMIAGFSQGMLLPLLAIMLEQIGISSSLNGLNAAGLYIGILLVSPFIEKPVRHFGYKPVIVTGLVLVATSLLLFPFWQVFWFWFILRVIVGIGDNLIHYATQVWITSTSPKKKRGRNLSIYGLAFGIGFGIGPLMTRLLSINEFLPFIIASVTSLLSWFFILLLRNEWPDNEIETGSRLNTFSRYKKVFSLAWFALLPGFCYGYLEATLHGSFPVYALRSGITIEWVSILLPSFVVGSLITQLPLGMLSDKIGRKNVLLSVLFLGFVSFIAMAFLESSMIGLLVCFIVAGMFLGSLFSLGIAYLADLIPSSLIPTGNVVVSICFALGSIAGPVIGGIFIDVFGDGSIYYSISGMLLLVLIAGLVFSQRQDVSELDVKRAAI
ncbi:MFS transporter [Anaerobacillus isosaccharinicus]|uniref:MFS transporter n=1 Tax=Anaerobacillus isosaccharinicus TaxID=1532552 RepID=A0A1S2L8C0_9BACI|nr:MFS transporter [Anaerobacillus isosaccharinicus]MBA5588648.1 MFS transporter [Anaerobacillus isosaccharinicus]QOY37945.1 MFS transporter [Anaerobacillus isosaccharinicus]